MQIWQSISASGSKLRIQVQMLATDRTKQDEPPQTDTSDAHEKHHPLHSSSSISTMLLSALRNSDQLTAMVSNYSTSYNAVNVSIVLPVLKYSLYGDTSPSPEKDEQDSLVASSLLAGMIFGQMLGGYLGDIIGRRNAMMVVMGLQIGASLGGACISISSNTGMGTLEQLAVWRLVLGIGAGGVYPLAAVMSVENSNGESDTKKPDDDTVVDAVRHGNQKDNEQTITDNHVTNLTKENPSDEDLMNEKILSFRRLALTFSMQGLGFITVPLLSYPMLALHWNINLIWRLLLGFGALPGFCVMYLRLFGYKNREKSKRGSLELIQQVTDEERSHTQNEYEDESSFHSTVSTLFTEMVEGDPSLHVNEEHQLALIDNTNLDDSEQYDGFHDETNVFNDKSESIPTQKQITLWSSIKNEPNLAGKIVGTAGIWFLFDVLFYGNTLFEPVVLEAAFGTKDNVEDRYTLLLLAVRDSMMISFLSLPGYFVTVMLIGKRTCVCQSLRSPRPSRCNSISPCTQTPSFIQMQGFLVMFLLYLIIGLYWISLSNIQWLLLLLYAGSFFFANYGPNSTTFMLPSVTYSKECRSTLNGLSAAAGKLGALVGASAFEPATDKWGESVVMVICAVVSLCGFWLTKVCVGREKH